jgi:hypothetical protein
MPKKAQNIIRKLNVRDRRNGIVIVDWVMNVYLNKNNQPNVDLNFIFIIKQD